MKSILLVDDETEICAELGQTLRRLKLRVEMAGSLEEALDGIERSPYDAVVLEFNLRSDRKAYPRTGGGLEVVRRLRASGVKTPILLFTAMEGEFYEKESLKAGADDFILKTDGVSCLVSCLHTHLRRHEQASMDKGYR